VKEDHLNALPFARVNTEKTKEGQRIDNLNQCTSQRHRKQNNRNGRMTKSPLSEADQPLVLAAPKTRVPMTESLKIEIVSLSH
jgi:hypothetical protein